MEEQKKAEALITSVLAHAPIASSSSPARLLSIAAWDARAASELPPDVVGGRHHCE